METSKSTDNTANSQLIEIENPYEEGQQKQSATTAKQGEGVTFTEEGWQEVFDLNEIETVEQMNDLIYKVSSFLVHD